MMLMFYLSITATEFSLPHHTPVSQVNQNKYITSTSFNYYVILRKHICIYMNILNVIFINIHW